MAYEQNYDSGLDARQHNANQHDYAKNQMYDQTFRGYNEQAPNAQRHNFYEPKPVQRPQNSAYPQSVNGGYNAGEYYHEDNGYNGNRVHRGPQEQFPMRDYNKSMNRPPRQPPQPRPDDARQREIGNAPAPRSAAPYQVSDRYDMHNQPHVPRPYQGGRGQHNGSIQPNYDAYVENDGYNGHNHGGKHYDHHYDGQNEQSYQPNNSQQHHRRGHSDGYGHRGGINPHSARRDFAQQRPSYDQPDSRFNNGVQTQQKRRILNDPISPQTVSWDNPFPTFPAPKKRSGQPENSLDGSMADMSLRGGAGKPGDIRPQTANSRSNTETSNTMGGIRSGRGNSPPFRDARFPQTVEVVGTGNQRQEVYDNYQNPRQRDPTQNGARPPMGSGREERRFYPDHGRSDSPAGRHPGEPIRGQYPRHQAASELDSGRSRTMPSVVSNSVMEFQPQKGRGQTSEWHESERSSDFVRPANRVHQPERPSTASSSRPAAPGQTRSGEISRLRSEQKTSPLGNGSPNVQQKAVRPPAVHQDSISDLYDSYYNGPLPVRPNTAQRADHDHQPPIEEDMPNFDAVPLASPGHQRGMTIDDHISPRVRSPEMPPIPSQYRQGDPATFHSGSSRQIAHSKSQPDLKNRRPPITQQDNGFDFGLPETTPGLPQDRYHSSRAPTRFPTERQEYDRRPGPPVDYHPRPSSPYHANGVLRPSDQLSHPDGGARPRNVPQQFSNQQIPEQYRTNTNTASSEFHGKALPSQPQFERYRSPNGQDRAPSNGPSPGVERGPASPPPATPINPDALPAHPAPVRPGLIQSSSPNQPPKPAPIRNYNNNASPLQESNIVQPPDPAQQPNKQPVASTITSNGLEKLRLVAKSNPTDQKAQMALATGLIQVASALEGYVPQTDQKARNKTRERYISEALKTIKRLVSTGYPDAMFFLGDCYSQGRLVLEKDTKEAFTLYLGAAKAGHAQAAFRVAVCCELGLEEDGGTKRDLGKAVQWYKRAATLGDTPAMYKTGVIQLKGLLGQPKDSGEAVVWLRRAAEKADKDNPHALHELALWHEAASSSGKAAGDEAYAKQLFVQAAELGYKFSQYRLGRACEYGLMGCPIDPRLSISWYSKAAVQEEHQSELALSGWYLTGAEGVLQQSDTEAYLWARKAATAGLAKAEFAMGYFTEVGIGCPPSSEEAKRWYWRAASQNFPKARERLEELRKGGAKMKKERVSRSAMKQESECSIM